MIPAKISNLNPVQVTGYKLPEPQSEEYFISKHICNRDSYNDDYEKYLGSKFIADVENVIKWSSFIGVNILENDIWTPRELELNQIVFIEPTTEGRCKIIKLL